MAGKCEVHEVDEIVDPVPRVQPGAVGRLGGLRRLPRRRADTSSLLCDSAWPLQSKASEL